jgi:hypothetical protein
MNTTMSSTAAQIVVSEDPGPWAYEATVMDDGRAIAQLRIERDESSGGLVPWIEIVQPGPFRVAEAETVAEALTSIAAGARMAQRELEAHRTAS